MIGAALWALAALLISQDVKPSLSHIFRSEGHGYVVRVCATGRKLVADSQPRQQHHAFRNCAKVADFEVIKRYEISHFLPWTQIAKHALIAPESYLHISNRSLKDIRAGFDLHTKRERLSEVLESVSDFSSKFERLFVRPFIPEKEIHIGAKLNIMGLPRFFETEFRKFKRPTRFKSRAPVSLDAILLPCRVRHRVHTIRAVPRELRTAATHAGVICFSAASAALIWASRSRASCSRLSACSR